MNRAKRLSFVVAILAVLGMPSMAYGYVGPGAGIGLIGAAIGLIVAVFTAFGVVVMWPLRALRKRAKGEPAAEVTEVHAGSRKTG